MGDLPLFRCPDRRPSLLAFSLRHPFRLADARELHGSSEHGQGHRLARTNRPAHAKASHRPRPTAHDHVPRRADVRAGARLGRCSGMNPERWGSVSRKMEGSRGEAAGSASRLAACASGDTRAACSLAALRGVAAGGEVSRLREHVRPVGERPRARAVLRERGAAGRGSTSTCFRRRVDEPTRPRRGAHCPRGRGERRGGSRLGRRTSCRRGPRGGFARAVTCAAAVSG